MKKNHPASESGFFNPRIFAAFLLCSVGAWLAMFSFASTPSSGTLTAASGPLTYDAGPFTIANPTPVLLVDSGPRCNGTTNPCDNYTLNVQLPSGYAAANPNASIKVTLSWVDTGSGQSDYDLYIFKGVVGNTSGSQSADAQSASGNNPEVANISLANPALYTDNGSVQQYSIKIVPYTPTGEVVHVRIELLQGGPGGGGGGGNFGGADPAAPGQPRYQIFYAPPGSTAESSEGEFNIGYDISTGRIMVMNLGPVWRLTPREVLNASNPECCEALWEDVSPVVTETGLDPILFTDQNYSRTDGIQRTFASNFTGGANALYAYSDDDGNTWTQVGLGSGNGGADHETIGTGAYPAALASLSTFPPAPNPNWGHAAYYCSQDIVGPAACYRSDTLGASWGPLITLPYNGNTDICGGLHGHLHVAPDGTIWLPVNQCSGHQGGAYSTDGGTTWTEFQVPSTLAGGSPQTGISQTQGADPSVAIDSDSRIYYAYVNNQAGRTEGHARAAVGTLTGCTVNPITGVRSGCTITWSSDIDLGSTHGIVNAAEIEAVGGGSGRAAVGFLGTNVAGDYQAGTFPGVWYAFIATTYDNGAHWVTVNATPNDPVQRATGIWQQGGSGQNGDRNLLDFNEITVDSKGHALYGFSDGCVTQGCIDGTAGNDKVAFMRVARQSGGKSLYISNDQNTDLPGGPARAPKPPCLSGSRSPNESLLSWKAPDNGGSDITNYQIYRSNTSGGEVLIGQTGNASTTFRDLNPPSDTHLFYRVQAVNSAGAGALSNEIDLVAVAPPPPQSPCTVPGLTILSDKAGDTSAVLGVINTPAPAGSDLLSFQLAQPYQTDNIPRLVFTINTDPNTTNLESAGWSAYVAMKFVRGTTTTYKGVHMTFKAGNTAPTFESYTPSPNSSGGVDGRFVSAGSQKPAEPGSNYNGATGTITIIVKASDLGLAAGDTINGFVSGTSQTSDVGGVGSGATALYDQMPDSLAFAGGYTVNSNQVCDPRPDLVVSTLTASNNQAPQGSKVTFTAKITNQGKTSAGASSTQFKDGNTVLGSVLTTAIPANGSVTVTFNWYTASAKKGTHTITATADSGNVVAESNEGNNTKQITVTIQGNKT